MRNINFMTRHYYSAAALLLAICLWGAAGAGHLLVTTVSSQTANSLSEGFEAGGKTAYTTGTVALGSGSWTLDDALLGNTTSDRRVGAYSARVRNVGKVRMNFNVATAGVISIGHAKYGTDAASTWELWKSSNSGSTWSKVGSTITSSSTSLVTATFTVNSTAAVRFEIRKVSGGTNRINLDSVIATSYAAPTPTPTPTPTATPIATPTPTPTATPVPSTSIHLAMGNPSNAVKDVNQPFNYLMEKPQYALSYSRGNNTANWVSWHLDPSWLGSTPRQDDFREDTTLPAGWYQVQETDYQFATYGFDRGHYTGSADRTVSIADNSATFLMTNMMPQSPDNNQGPWNIMEQDARALVTTGGKELYTVMGGHGSGGTTANGTFNGISTPSGQLINVPNQVWKVIVVLDRAAGDDVARVTTTTRVIAVIMPNTTGIRTNDWRQYRVSVDQIEALTGYNFLSNVPDNIESIIESKVDNQ